MQIQKERDNEHIVDDSEDTVKMDKKKHKPRQLPLLSCGIARANLTNPAALKTLNGCAETAIERGDHSVVAETSLPRLEAVGVTESSRRRRVKLLLERGK
ncbi:hypothetical protein RRG08_004913 [Elysia crispata]|uniref:Uncharacterized protein n=1 Tax=Elysia crispata TaxID=231223 RepID=A0AAE0ZJ14_9GAST|nr:hypothetical protein RRG08_004913 [Elysia crispata]